jgi:hypothetical protein
VLAVSPPILPQISHQLDGYGYITNHKIQAAKNSRLSKIWAKYEIAAYLPTCRIKTYMSAINYM